MPLWSRKKLKYVSDYGLNIFYYKFVLSTYYLYKITYNNTGDNMFSNFSIEAKNILISAKREMNELKHPYVGSEHLLLAILKSNNEVSNKLKEYNVTYNIFKDEIIKVIGIGNNTNNYLLYTPLLRRVIENSTLDSREDNTPVSISTLFSNILEEGEGVAIRILLGLNVDIDKIYSEFSYKVIKNKKKNKKTILQDIGIDLTLKAFNNELDPVIGRNEEIKRTMEILLRKNKNNPLLIGEAGVGKTAIVEGIAQLISKNNVPMPLRNKKIINIDMSHLVAGTKYRGEFEEKIKKLLKELEEDNDIILFIDEIHTLVGAGGAEGAIDASNIFKPYLARGKIKIIGATTTLEYKKFIENDKALDRRFQKVTIEEPNLENLKNIIYELKPVYENYHNVILNNNILDLIIELSNKYIYDRYNPDKTIDILDEVCAKVSIKENNNMKKYNEYNKKLQDIINTKNKYIKNNNYDDALEYKIKENEILDKINSLEIKMMNNKEKVVSKSDVIKVISEKSNIPVYELNDINNKLITNIKNDIKNNIIGQDNIIDDVIKIIRKIKSGYKDNVYSLLFVGPSGVGKNCMAKLISKNLTNHLIRLDMSEFSESHTVSKIIGAPAGYVGYSNSLNVLEEVRSNPYSVILLDEIEKASPSVLDLFYQILDEGYIKDSKGTLVNFKNTIIIMTSNIGFENESIGFNTNTNNKLKDYFKKSFINRIDNILVFNHLTYDDINTIVKKKITMLRKKYKNLNIKNSDIEYIINNSEYNIYGARKLEKLINDYVFNIIDNKKDLIKSS